jgi:hypothetical protein
MPQLSDRLTPIGAIARGLVAGAAGTAAMTAAQTADLKATGGESSSTPGEVGRRISEGVLQREVSDDEMPVLNNVMHWAYGTSWGPLYGIVAGSRRRADRPRGLAFGLVVWGASLVHLPAMKLAPPVWEYPPQSLASEVGFHVVYGVAAGAAWSLLDRR